MLKDNSAYCCSCIHSRWSPDEPIFPVALVCEHATRCPLMCLAVLCIFLFFRAGHCPDSVSAQGGQQSDARCNEAQQGTGPELH
jgi:hypothetical protein